MFCDDIGQRIVSVTPDFSGMSFENRRYMECHVWMGRHREPWQPWIAVDDHARDFGMDFPLSRLLVTNPSVGFTQEDGARLREMIEREIAAAPGAKASYLPPKMKFVGRRK